MRELSNFPAGAIIFLHENAPTEHIAYMDETSMIQSLQMAVNSNLNPNTVWPYVDPDRTELVEKLYRITQSNFGKDYSIYALTRENLNVVLADYRISA